MDHFPLLLPVDISVTPEETEPFPVVPVAIASTVTAVAVGAGLLVYFKKRKR